MDSETTWACMICGKFGNGDPDVHLATHRELDLVRGRQSKLNKPLQTFKCADCGNEFVADSYHALCSACRKRYERLKKGLPLEKAQDDITLDWWVPR